MSSKSYRSSELQGKTVIEMAGNRLGKAKEVALSLDGTAMLVVEKDDGSESLVPTSKVVAIGEFVVVKSDISTAVPAAVQVPTAVPNPPSPMQSGPVCRSCGAALKPGARFCTKCGTSVL